MLDNTLIYCGVESGTDHNHSPRDMQYLLIGGRTMGIAVGQFCAPGADVAAARVALAVAAPMFELRAKRSGSKSRS
jgi:hypothetical protein